MTPRATAGAALYSEGRAQKQLAGALRATSAIAAVAVASGAVPGEAALMYRKAAYTIARFLDIELVEILLTAWRTEGAIAKAANTTAAHPDQTETVHLLSQHISWSHDAALELQLDGRSYGPVPVNLEVELEIGTLDADVRGGRLVELASGRTTASVRLSVAGQEVRSGSLDFELGVVLALGDGIPLVATVDVTGRQREQEAGIGRRGHSGR